jgi:hypothetical protein
MDKRETILCAAIYYNDGKARVHQPVNARTGIVVTGLRHCNCYAVLAELFPNREYKGNQVEGFLTNSNRFVKRNMAAQIAFHAGQTSEKKGELCSEDLY